MFRYISSKIKYSLKCVLNATFERENVCRWPKLSGFSGTEVNQTSSTIRCGCLYMRDRFGKVCVMHFRADMINHRKLRTTTVFVEQNPSLSLLDNKWSLGWKGSYVLDWPRTHYLWSQSSKFTCTHPALLLRCEAEVLFVFKAERPFGLNYEPSLVFFEKVK